MPATMPMPIPLPEPQPSEQNDEVLEWAPDAASGGSVPVDPLGGGGGGPTSEQRSLATLMNDILGGAPRQPLARTGEATRSFASAIGAEANPNVLLAGMYWWSVLHGPAAQRELRVTDRADRLLVAHADGTRLSLLALTRDDSVTEPVKLDFSVSTGEILGLSGSDDRRASVGLVLRENGSVFATTALHAVAGSPDEVVICGVHGTVITTSVVSDSCLIRFDHTPSIAVADNFAGFYDGEVPRDFQKVRFHRLDGECVHTKVISTDMDAYDPDPSGRVRSYTDPVTIPSDSGVALLDESDVVVGFAYKRTKRNAYVQFSSWIWAQQVVTELGIAEHLQEGCHGLVD
ncbi:hypothetical protein [Kibdelosporangium aridum]|uniref:hypothetical protein n=1 Tax=Kibdelosporangium aridum TaxID=2030 RepID=UPI0035E639D7